MSGLAITPKYSPLGYASSRPILLAQAETSDAGKLPPDQKIELSQAAGEKNLYQQAVEAQQEEGWVFVRYEKDGGTKEEWYCSSKDANWHGAKIEYDIIPDLIGHGAKISSITFYHTHPAYAGLASPPSTTDLISLGQVGDKLRAEHNYRGEFKFAIITPSGKYTLEVNQPNSLAVVSASAAKIEAAKNECLKESDWASCDFRFAKHMSPEEFISMAQVTGLKITFEMLPSAAENIKGLEERKNNLIVAFSEIAKDKNLSVEARESMVASINYLNKMRINVAMQETATFILGNYERRIGQMIAEQAAKKELPQ